MVTSTSTPGSIEMEVAKHAASRGWRTQEPFLSVSNGNLDLDSGFDRDGGDLLDNLGRGVEIDDTLVDPHLKPVPGLGTFTARSLSGGDPQDPSWHPHWALDLEFLLLGTMDQVSTDLFQTLDIVAGEVDPNPVDHCLFGLSFGVLVGRHVGCSRI